MSSHLKILATAEVIDSERDGKRVVYKANYDTVRELVLFLMKDCCAGNNAVCRPVAESLAVNA
jgi:DNA-binding transcriptional ArsR family regulator